MNLGITDKIAIVTGAAQGIGRSIAFSMAQEGATIVIADVDFQKAGQVAWRIKNSGGKALTVKVDVSKQADVDRLVDKVISRYGCIDILVNNAGICPRTEFEKISVKEWDNVLAINLKSVFLLSQKVFPYMRQNRCGNIINLASGAGKVGGVQASAHYAASKAGVICLTKTLALHGAKYGIRVNAVCPGVIKTEMTTKITKSNINKYKQMIPLGEIGSPEDVASTVLFLASDMSNYITGEIIDVNGGFIMD